MRWSLNSSFFVLMDFLVTYQKYNFELFKSQSTEAVRVPLCLLGRIIKNRKLLIALGPSLGYVLIFDASTKEVLLLNLGLFLMGYFQ